jgi:hypothetical protein
MITIGEVVLLFFSVSVLVIGGILGPILLVEKINYIRRRK